MDFSLLDELRQEGFELMVDVAPILNDENVTKVVVAAILRKRGEQVTGEMILARAHSSLSTCLGLQDAKFLLGKQGLIPKSFRECTLVFRGTILYSIRSAGRCVACLCWPRLDGRPKEYGLWKLHMSTLDRSDWGSLSCPVSLRS